jgi:hypothetical protein
MDILKLKEIKLIRFCCAYNFSVSMMCVFIKMLAIISGQADRAVM